MIYDVSYKNRIRPSRPLTVTVVQSGIALAASPVSAAMAAMLTLTDVAPYDLGLAQILAITLPACVIGIVVTSLVVNRMWKDLDDDPEVQAKITSGELAPRPRPGADRRRPGRRHRSADLRRPPSLHVHEAGPQLGPRLPRSASWRSSSSGSSPTCGPPARSTARPCRST